MSHLDFKNQSRTQNCFDLHSGPRGFLVFEKDGLGMSMLKKKLWEKSVKEAERSWLLFLDVKIYESHFSSDQNYQPYP